MRAAIFALCIQGALCAFSRAPDFGLLVDQSRQVRLELDAKVQAGANHAKVELTKCMAKAAQKQSVQDAHGKAQVHALHKDLEHAKKSLHGLPGKKGDVSTAMAAVQRAVRAQAKSPLLAANSLPNALKAIRKVADNKIDGLVQKVVSGKKQDAKTVLMQIYSNLQSFMNQQTEESTRLESTVVDLEKKIQMTKAASVCIREKAKVEHKKKNVSVDAFFNLLVRLEELYTSDREVGAKPALSHIEYPKVDLPKVKTVSHGYTKPAKHSSKKVTDEEVDYDMRESVLDSIMAGKTPKVDAQEAEILKSVVVAARRLQSPLLSAFAVELYETGDSDMFYDALRAMRTNIHGSWSKKRSADEREWCRVGRARLDALSTRLMASREGQQHLPMLNQKVEKANKLADNYKNAAVKQQQTAKGVNAKLLKEVQTVKRIINKNTKLVKQISLLQHHTVAKKFKMENSKFMKATRATERDLHRILKASPTVLHRAEKRLNDYQEQSLGAISKMLSAEWQNREVSRTLTEEIQRLQKVEKKTNAQKSSAVLTQLQTKMEAACSDKQFGIRKSEIEFIDSLQFDAEN